MNGRRLFGALLLLSLWTPAWAQAAGGAGVSVVERVHGIGSTLMGYAEDP